MRGRYAPSPSGDLHLGNARTALLAWWHVRSNDGTFVLRMDDLDPDRSKPEAARGILADLRWLGIDWDEGPDTGGPCTPYSQSERASKYEEALDKLMRGQRVYPCACTRAEVRAAASAPHGGAGGARSYPGTCRPQEGKDWETCVGATRARSQRLGRLPSFRFAVPTAKRLKFTDEVSGFQECDVPRDVGDFIVRRSDGVAAYHLATAFDDADQKITHVLRGDDLLATTPCQILVMEALGLPLPTYLHVPLVVNRKGRRLAKRKGDLTLTALRAGGVRPERIVGLLAWTCGLVRQPQEVSASEIIELFSLDKVPRRPAVLDHRALSRLEATG